MTQSLSPEDWIAAGFRALAADGPQAIKAEKLARALGTTKGSFYWHFKDVPAFHAAMLAMWEKLAVGGVIEDTSRAPEPEDQLRALIARAGAPAPEHYGGVSVEPAIRAWALQNESVAEAVAQVDAARMKHLRELLSACGLSEHHAVLIYGAYVGLEHLQSRGVPDTAGALADLIEVLLTAT
ncbi:MAG: TetR/AcrR family transcriptional regulator [Pseudomonadota bacterium]